ncbi:MULTISPECIES: RidA family protein [Brevibacterium]|uniref:Enamine deaminase RidA, house cleaning of reactive enamine intermediates, YjgF/YER057c/UK114 family n=2 Tax=Brevibacterium antiquum TaxID=234835 RepID=A0A2H1IYB0_9MICO|nr:MULTISPECIES: RidA family protein [Brevibacterium]SMX76158.1 Enamine deaminase RidA, house cleaning of reactive enamine intermediates, YjgF/YER057c/UK114 family [Brevibacterium antiquum]SMX80193.1 Enamine deaminase RidA, house cleaning of reactive enamine intermediates, YjgF/YER057c/UK114 family [Brevibacterium antiquum CNRZ 918]HCG55440.1 RidA family protein [Brevibacterium sp.]
MSKTLDRIAELGLTLPDVATPAGAYVPALRTGNYVYTSGQLPVVDGKLPATGHIGSDVDLETGYDLARTAGLNALAAIAGVIGDLDRIVRVVKVTGFVNSADDFTQQPSVINGVSELYGEIFGDRGQHTRSAVGVNTLPLGTPVEVEVVVEVEDDAA